MINVYKKAGELMIKDLVTVKAMTPVTTFKDHFKRRHFHHILVENEDKELIGIISNLDVLRDRNVAVEDKLVAKDIMTKNPITINRKTPMIDILKEFLNNDFRALPVVGDYGKLEGIITPHDIMNIVVEKFEEKIY